MFVCVNVILFYILFEYHMIFNIFLIVFKYNHFKYFLFTMYILCMYYHMLQYVNMVTFMFKFSLYLLVIFRDNTTKK